MLTLPAQRNATTNDLVKRLTDTPYDWTAVTALGWGMGPAQLGIEQAVEHAIDAGYLVSEVHNGKTFVQLAPLYTLTYETDEGPQVRDSRPARSIETIGRVVMRLADRVKAWNIEVTDANGNDVTHEFTCFQDPIEQQADSSPDEVLLLGGPNEAADHYRL